MASSDDQIWELMREARALDFGKQSIPQCAYRIPWKSVGPISTGNTKLRNVVGPQATVRPALKVPVTSEGHTIVLSFAVTSTLDGPAGGSVDITQLRRTIAAIDHERSRSAAF